MTAKKLVCIVEGKGELSAMPALCVRVRDELQAWSWIVDSNPVRWDRGKMVNQRMPSPMRGVHADFERAVKLAFKRADAVLALCDQDDDCPVVWGLEATAVIARHGDGGALMVVREFETWFINGCFAEDELAACRLTNPERNRDGKAALRKLFPAYKPTIHQKELVSKMDLTRTAAHSRSFRKLRSELQRIFCKQ